jgi:hypothetical protein
MGGLARRFSTLPFGCLRQCPHYGSLRWSDSSKVGKVPRYRKTHNHPYGKPLPLVLLDIAMAILLAVCVFIVAGHWLRATGVTAVLLVVVFISTRLERRYKRTRPAVRIPRPGVVVKFSKGLRSAIVTARNAFFLTVAITVVLGVAPVAASTARIGIVVCLFALIGVAVLNLAIERQINAGHSTVVDSSVQSAGRNREQ